MALQLTNLFNQSSQFSNNTSSVGSGASTSSGSGMGTVASGVISGLSDIATGFINASRTANTLKFNSSMGQLQADYNAGMTELQGRMIRLSADIQIKNIRKKAQSLFSSQRAAYANAGVKMSGSAVAVMVDSLKESELDVIYENISADYNVGLTKTQADSYRTEAQVQSNINAMTAKSAKIDAYTNAAQSILNMGVKKYTRG